MEIKIGDLVEVNLSRNTRDFWDHKLGWAHIQKKKGKITGFLKEDPKLGNLSFVVQLTQPIHLSRGESEKFGAEKNAEIDLPYEDLNFILQREDFIVLDPMTMKPKMENTEHGQAEKRS